MASLKAVTLDLQNQIVAVYDQTKTTLSGNAAQRTFQGSPVIAPPSVKWIDVFTDAAETPIGINHTPAGRIYAITAITGGLARLMCYSFNATTGAHVYLGKVALTFPNLAATTHTIRGFKVDDTNANDIRVFVGTTGSVAINGGLFMTNALPLSDFTQILSTTLPMATGNNQKAVYFLQDSAGVGAGQLNTVTTGVSIDRGTKIAYVHNGTAATHQVYLYDYNFTPDVPGATVTLSITSPGVVTETGHTRLAGDQINFSTTGALPTGIVAGTTYFVKTVTANTFEIAATTGGTSINFTGAQSGVHTVRRAFGITTALAKWKTGNLPALTGTLLNNNSEKRIIPSAAFAIPAFVAVPTLFFATSTALYVGFLSELTAGATSWPSLATVNLLGSTNQVVAPTAVNAGYDEFFDAAVYTTSVTKIIAKRFVNNQIGAITGILNNDYLEGVSQTDLLTEIGAITIGDISCQSGWTFIIGTSIGQRGLIGTNGGADWQAELYGASSPSYIISKVFTLPALSTLIGVAVSSVAPDKTATPVIYYRTTGFGVAAGNWILLPKDLLFPPSTMAQQIQIKILWNIAGSLVTNPTLVEEGYLAYVPVTTISDNWIGSVDNTTPNGVTPTKTAFRLVNAYTSSVPQLFFRAFDDSGNLVATADTVSNPSLFEYTTNNGSSWNALGTIPNTVDTTELRYNWATPPGVRVTCSLNES